jgi:tripartite-type tricarboxylate transporter receptor subunit TctC
MHSRRLFHTRALALGAAGCLPAWAQTGAFPNRLVKIVVPYAAGGGPDVQTRKIAQKFAEVLGKPVVVENIVGAGGILAAQTVARAPADGYTILLGASTHVTQKAMLPSVKFDPVKDFVHITRSSYSPQVLIVAADAPYKTLQDLLAAARREPGKLNYASGGVGSAAHLAGAAVAMAARLDVVHVPYKGSVEIVPSILSGATQFAFPVSSTAIPQVTAGKVRALATTGVARLPNFPAVPTLRESLQNDELAMDSWGGFWAPAGTPADAIDVIFRALLKVFADPAVKADTEAGGSLVAPSASPAEFSRFIEAETVKYERLVKAANLAVAN